MIEHYNTSKLEIIDKFMTKIRLRFINGCNNSNNTIIQKGKISEESFTGYIQNDGYLSPLCLTRLENHTIYYIMKMNK